MGRFRFHAAAGVLRILVSAGLLSGLGCTPVKPEEKPPELPLEGQCGGANGVTRVSAPTTDLCSVGTPSSVAGSGPWTWTCTGVRGGGNASCQASLAGPEGSRLPIPGNPDGTCTTRTLPEEAKLVDTSHPTTIVGTGTPESCTFAALSSAVAKGGIITFDCGEELVTIPVTRSLTPPTSNAYAGEKPVSTVLDGGNKVTLDGGKAVRLITWEHEGSWLKNDDALTLQRIRLINGKAAPTEAIPTCSQTPNDQCPTGHFDGQGGALYMRDGALRVIDCTFADNEAALLGPDTGGGALYIFGTAHPAYIVGSTFRGNRASNAGGVGMLWAGAFIFNSLFEGNAAVGHGANSNDPAHCACITNDHNQVGSGGNGGAIYKDGGDDQDVTVCGTQLRNNSVNEHGAAIFLTANGSSAKLVLEDTLVKDNESPYAYWQWCPSVSTDNPHEDGNADSAPAPVNSRFCKTDGSCTSTCSG